MMFIREKSGYAAAIHYLFDVLEYRSKNGNGRPVRTFSISEEKALAELFVMYPDSLYEWLVLSACPGSKQ